MLPSILCKENGTETGRVCSGAATAPRMISISDRRRRTDGRSDSGVQIMQLHRLRRRPMPRHSLLLPPSLPPSCLSKAPLKMFSAMTLSFLPSILPSFLPFILYCTSFLTHKMESRGGKQKRPGSLVDDVPSAMRCEHFFDVPSFLLSFSLPLPPQSSYSQSVCSAVRSQHSSSCFGSFRDILFCSVG